MKIMKKTIFFLSTIALIVLGALSLSCTALEDERNANGSVTYSLSVNRGETTKALEESGNNLSKSFAKGDKIALVYQAGGVTKVVQSNALTDADIHSGGKSADFSVTLDGTPDENSPVKYIYPASLANNEGEVNYDALKTQEGTLASIAAKLDLGLYEGTLSGTTLPASVTLANPLVICNFTIKDGDTDMTSAVTKLTIKNGSTVYFVNNASPLSNIWVAVKPVTSGNISIYAAKGKDLYTKEVTSPSLAAGNYYDITVTTAQIPGAISGLFTINASGDLAYFSQGNLQYIGSATTPYWKFADSQTGYLGTTTGQNSNATNVDRDLFGWGTKDYPNKVSTNNADYNTWAEWGNNAILNGGNTENSGWHTLTYDEWSYIFSTRSPSSGTRYAKAVVNGVNGVILLPDDWNNSYYTLSQRNQKAKDFTSNNVNSDNWTNKLEAHGAVFLPAAGYRTGTDFNGTTSSFYGSSSGSTNGNAYYMFFSPNAMDYYTLRNRHYGASVRLVRKL